MPETTLVEPALLREWPLPGPGADKEDRGRLVVVAGSRATPGAGLLSVEGAFRAGAGKVCLATVTSAAPALATAAPELMVSAFPETASGSLDPSSADGVVDGAAGSAVVLLGPGFTDPEDADALVRRVVPRLEGTVVLDALATAYVTDNHAEVASLAADVVLTVNPRELACCLGEDGEPDEDHLGEGAKRLADLTGAVVLCGGTAKHVSDGDRLWRVESGNPGLGTAGSGDVQAGVVAGLLARGADPVQAAVWGAFLHGAAGDRLAARVGDIGYLARELPGEVPGLLTDLA